MNIFKAIIFFFLMIPCTAYTATIPAASSNRADVATAIDSANYGDTVTIPAGTSVWTSGIAIAKDIKIVGSGIDSTILKLGFTNNSTEEAFFKFIPDATARNNLDSLTDTNTFIVTGITFAGSSRMGNKFGVWVNNYSTPLIKRVRINNNKFTNIYRAVQIKGYVYGVMDSNVMINSDASYPQGAGLEMWTNNYLITPGSGNGWYIEDNTFTFDNDGIVTGANNEGMGQIVRYNTTSGGLHDNYVECHGNQLAGIKAGQVTEIYGNNFSSTASAGIAMRGGKCMVFVNRVNDDTISIREEFQDSASGTLPANQCVSANPQICEDSYVCWKVHNSYFWNNRRLSTNNIQAATILYDRYDNVNANDPPELVEEREFWNYNASFNGTSGIGCGTLAARPTTCDVGVGYWATNQSCSDLTGMIGANPTTPISGTLYRCTAPNTWTAYYTPYTYPHPLRNAATTVQNNVLPSLLITP